MKDKRVVVAFDFDGTLTTKDSMIEFIKYAFGKRKFYIGFFLHLPMLVFMKVGIYSNWKVKEKIFSWFFKGMKYDDFVILGKEFAIVISTFVNSDTISVLNKHIQEKADIYVITASIEEWVRPFCKQLKVNTVLGTKVEVVDNLLTGRFASNNCYGKEKVSRLLEIEHERSSYVLYAYGDSCGDKELLDFAEFGFKIH